MEILCENFPSHLFTFHTLVQLLLPTVKLNRVSLPISIDYKVMQFSPFYINTNKCLSHSSIKTPLFFNSFLSFRFKTNPQDSVWFENFFIGRLFKAFNKSTSPITTKKWWQENWFSLRQLTKAWLYLLADFWEHGKQSFLTSAMNR